MKLSPRVVPGALHLQNRGACDWGWQSLVAYGSQTFVVVLDPKTVQQNLDETLVHQPFRKLNVGLDQYRHTSVQDKGKIYVASTQLNRIAMLKQVKWSRENFHHDFAAPYALRLASGDTFGKLIIWDVSLGKPLIEFSDGSKPILDIEWLATQDACHDLLAVLHAPSSLILWNADTGTKLWKKTFQESLLCFAFDPFIPSNVTLMCQEWILFINDFSINKAPESNGRRFFLTSSGATSPSAGTPTNSAAGTPTASGQRSSTALMSRVKLWAAGEQRNRSGEESVALSECLQLAYLPSFRHHLLALFPKEVMILDMEINQAVCSFCLEKSSPSFLQVIPCRQRDVLMCLHENGSVTVRVRRRISQNPYIPGETDNTDSSGSVDIVYENRCQSDALRLSKASKLFGLLCCPITERKIMLLISDGRVITWILKGKRTHFSESIVMNEESLKASLPCLPQSTEDLHTPILMLSDMIPPPLSSGDVIPSSCSLKFVMISLLNAVAAPPTCARMCPPLTTKNWASYKPLIAVGTTQGSVQVFNVATGLLFKEYSIHTGSVRGITWTSLHSFFSWAQTPGSSSKNELQLLDLTTGCTTHVFLGKAVEESTIDSVKVSHLRQYFLVLFKEKPMQLWDLKHLTVIKEMPSNFPKITALEWSPSTYAKHQLKKKQQQQEMQSPGSSSESIASHVLDPNRPDANQTANLIKEHFVCIDSDGLLYHILVEGNLVKDGTKIQCDSNIGTVTCMAWKGDLLVLADADGNISVWELKARITRALPTHRGLIKKIKFAPGRGNLKLAALFNDGMDIWDIKKLEIFSSYKLNKDASPVVDMDWLASDLPVIVHANGSIQVLDMELKTSSSPLDQMDIEDPVWSPHIMEPKSALALKSLLQHKFDRKTHSLEDILDLDLGNEDLAKSIQSNLHLISREVKEFLPKAPLGVAQKCLVSAQLFGDENELNFWNVALHFLRREKARLLCPVHKDLHQPPLQRVRSSSDFFNPSDATANLRRTFSSRSLDNLLSIDDDLNLNEPQETGESDSCCCYPVSLDTCYDQLCDNNTFQRIQLDRIALHDSKRSTYEHTKKCAETLVLLGQADRAVQLFLETDSENDSYLTDSLRACLVATIRSSGASQSTIKLVATNLIASGKLSEGVQLLSLIDKGLDACRYLQTYGDWDLATWLAKATLNYPDCAEVMRRWIEHLSSTYTSQQSKAVLVWLSLGKFYNALDMLYSMRYFERAALFAEACQEFGFLSMEDEGNASLVNAVFVEYARYLFGLGLKKPSHYFSDRAGDKGRHLLHA